MSYTVEQLLERFDDGVAALERIADALESKPGNRPEGPPALVRFPGGKHGVASQLARYFDPVDRNLVAALAAYRAVVGEA